MRLRARVVAFVFGVAFVAAACDQGATSITNTDSPISAPQLAVGDVISKPAADELGEKYVICKTGPTATFTVEADGVEVDGSPFTISDGECVVVFSKEGETATVTSYENVPAGVQLDQVVMTQLTCALAVGVQCNGGGPFVDGPNVVFTGPLAGPATSAGFSGFVGGTGGSTPSQWGLSGVLVEYTNSVIPTTGGGEGCTPGFWKNRGLTLGWPAPYTDDTLFSAVFEDAFPGMTLLEVLRQGGGGLIALGRHTVAALLNAASDDADVDYDLSAQEVIDMFNAVFPGTKAEYNDLKDVFEGFNQQQSPGFCD